MCKKPRIIFTICLLAFVMGCAQITEPVKVIWGSSTKALEDARVDAISKTYRCSFTACYDAVLSFARVRKAHAQRILEEEALEEEALDAQDDNNVPAEVVNKNYFDIFINNRKKRHMVVMGIPGNIETTEAGIFFSQPNLTTVKIEVTSLSSSAKRKVAKFVFDELSLRFSEAH